MRTISVTIVTLGLAATATAAADAPAYVAVQGVLTDTDGTPVEGDTMMRFGLYTSDIGGAEVWTESQLVLVEGGLFTAYLGDSTVLDLAVFRDHDALHLGVSVGGEAEMARFQIATAGYAGFAQYAGDAASLGGSAAADFAAATHAHGWSDLSGIPAGFADGTDDGTTYTAGAGLTLTGAEFAADQAMIEGWARGVCYDTEVELIAALDDNYAARAHGHLWTDLGAVPAGFPGAGSGFDADLLDAQHGAFYQNAGNLNAGTLDAARFSAYSDLTTEGYLDNTADTDLPTRLQADARFVNEAQPNSVTPAMETQEAGLDYVEVPYWSDVPAGAITPVPGSTVTVSWPGAGYLLAGWSGNAFCNTGTSLIHRLELVIGGTLSQASTTYSNDYAGAVWARQSNSWVFAVGAAGTGDVRIAANEYLGAGCTGFNGGRVWVAYFPTQY
jgi:hypothetical protein